jgi:phage RecT family recombinase
MAASLAEMKTQQANSGTAVAKKEKTIFDFLSGDPKIERAIQAVAGTYFTPDRFLRLAVNAVKKTPALALCDSSSVLGSFMTSAALGLEPNTVLQQAFLIPYKKRQLVNGQWVDVYECNFQIGARGFVTLAHRSPHIATLESEAIHKGDHFKHMKGSKSFLEYEKALADRGDLIGAFCFTKMADGNEMATVLPFDEIIKIRGRSETYGALSRALIDAQNGTDQKALEKALKKHAETPWVMWEDDMAAKSATKKHAKQLPISPGDALSVAAQLDGDDGRTIDMANMMDPDRVRAVMKEGVEAADTGGTGNETFSFRGATHTAETVEPNSVTERADAATAGQSQAGTPQPGQPDDRTEVEKLRHRLSTLKDLDMLDAEADLIKEVTSDPGEQADLTNAYKARRAALNGEVEPKQDEPTRPAARARRSGMVIE